MIHRGYGIRASRRIGSANGRNPLPVVVPCHRVIGAHGELTGYAGGVGIKRFLLELERDRGRHSAFGDRGQGCIDMGGAVNRPIP